MNNLAKLTIVIVTYKTDSTILKNCLNSIDKNVQIKIIENSFKKENQIYLLIKKIIYQFTLQEKTLVMELEIIMVLT